MINRTSLSITDENGDKKHDERGDIIAADVGLRHSALRVRIIIHLLTLNFNEGLCL